LGLQRKMHGLYIHLAADGIATLLCLVASIELELLVAGNGCVPLLCWCSAAFIWQCVVLGFLHRIKVSLSSGPLLQRGV
jgi:hypothetical protein